MKHNSASVFALWASLFVSLVAVKGQEESWDMLTAQPEVVEAWQDMRFGMFNCWGPVSLTGLEIGWSRGAPRGGEFRVIEGQGPTPAEVYDNLYTQWQPDQFDARQWVQIAKDAGMKYMIFLVKHHDGFCLYDTQLTDYRSTGPKSAWKVDVMKQVAEACHEADLKLIIYYSQPDWHHPDYRTKNHQRYIEYLHGQVRELLTNYGRIDGFWFDLGGKPEDWDTVKLFQMMRTLQPWLIINNRCGLPGDFDTPEQRLGSFQLERPWETCMTLGTQWSWKPDDKIKSLKECIDIAGDLCWPQRQSRAQYRSHAQWPDRTAPGPTVPGNRPVAGRVRPEHLRHARRAVLGARLSDHSEGQTPSTCMFSSGMTNVCCCRPSHTQILSHEVLTGGTATVQQSDQGLEILVPREHRSELDTIIALHLDGPASEIDVAPILCGPLTFGKKVTASHVYDANPAIAQQYRPELAVDGDPNTGWTFNPDQPTAWLEIDLEKAHTFDHAWLNEPYDRIREFELQAEKDGTWQTFLRGTTIGEDCTVTFTPVTAQRVRLVVLKTTINPLVGEFQLLEARVR